MPDGGEHALDRIGGPQVVPVLGGEVEEGEERVPVSLQAGDGLLVLRPVFLHEGVERERGRRPVGRTGDLVQVPLDLQRHGIRHRVDDVDHLVHLANGTYQRSNGGNRQIDETSLALKLIEEGRLRPSRRRSSWAGAMALVQFLPSDLYRYGVDA